MEKLEISKALGRVFGWVEPLTDAANAPITDATITVELVRLADDFVFDWDDQTFKDTGHVEASLTCTHKGAGIYVASGSFEQAGGGVDMHDGELLRVTVTAALAGGGEYTDAKLIQCTQEGYAAATTVNRHEIDLSTTPNQDVVYDIDGVTELGRHNLLDFDGDPMSDPTVGELAERTGSV